MGGSGSGRPYETVKLDQGLKLKIDWLMRNNFIEKGLWRAGTLSWSCVHTREPSSKISYQANLIDADDLWIRLIYTNTNYLGERRDIDYKIRIVTTQPHYGGHRYWFLCPHTGKRCGVLYSMAGRPYFTSRHAHKLKYQSQSRSHMQRVGDKMHSLRAKIEDGKPKGMHWKTYDRLCDELEDLEYTFLMPLVEKLQRKVFTA